MHRNLSNFDFCMLSFGDNVQRCYCEDCFRAVTEQHKKDVAEYARLKKKLMFERAVRLLERQSLELYDYQEAIKAVEEFAAGHPNKFDSAYEMIAAIMLIDNEIPCEMQYKVGCYQCDIRLPTMKVILEVDGDRHKYRKKFDAERDQEIMRELGTGWEVVRIKTDYLEKNADLLVEAIRAIVDERRKRKI